MVYMTSVEILDTGYLTVSSRGTQLSASYRANSGSAISLKGVNVDFTSTANLDESVTPARFPSTIHGHDNRALISVNPLIVVITIKINNKDTTDMGLLTDILKLPYTRGFKAIYYPVDKDASSGNLRNRNGQILHRLGTYDDTDVPQGDLSISLWDGSALQASKTLKNVNYVPVRFNSCKLTQVPSNIIELKLIGVVTG